MFNFIAPGSNVLGILGGGQLGKMLSEAAQKFMLQLAVLDPSTDASTANYPLSFTEGSLTDFDTVVAFGIQCQVLTIEIEHVNIAALAYLEQQGVMVRPSAQVLATIQDKGIQRTFYDKIHVPSPEYHLFETKQALLAFLAQSSKKWVWKARTGGYDGKGVKIINTFNDTTDLPETACLLEAKIDIATEAAVIVARNRNGEMAAYPTVEMVFHPEANLVEEVVMPSKLPDHIQQQMHELAYTIAENLGLEGVLAVEFFIDKAGKVWVNEAAPRVHNSGHLTIEACETSQFEQHLRAVLNMPLGSTRLITPACMLNIVGAPDVSGKAAYLAIEKVLNTPGAHVHLYGKKYTHPYRKMGHITVTGSTFEEVMQKSNTLKPYLTVTAYE